MDRARVSRLSKLEGSKLDALLVRINRKYVADDGEELPPVAYRDGIGNRWARMPGETVEAFRARASEAAINAGAGRVAVLVPLEVA